MQQRMQQSTPGGEYRVVLEPRVRASVGAIGWLTSLLLLVLRSEIPPVYSASLADPDASQGQQQAGTSRYHSRARVATSLLTCRIWFPWLLWLYVARPVLSAGAAAVVRCTAACAHGAIISCRTYSSKKTSQTVHQQQPFRLRPLSSTMATSFTLTSRPNDAGSSFCCTR